jgi:hypothetical protein
MFLGSAALTEKKGARVSGGQAGVRLRFSLSGGCFARGCARSPGERGRPPLRRCATLLRRSGTYVVFTAARAAGARRARVATAECDSQNARVAQGPGAAARPHDSMASTGARGAPPERRCAAQRGKSCRQETRAVAPPSDRKGTHQRAPPAGGQTRTQRWQPFRRFRKANEDEKNCTGQPFCRCAHRRRLAPAVVSALPDTPQALLNDARPRSTASATAVSKHCLFAPWASPAHLSGRAAPCPSPRPRPTRLQRCPPRARPTPTSAGAGVSEAAAAAPQAAAAQQASRRARRCAAPPTPACTPPTPSTSPSCHPPSR